MELSFLCEVRCVLYLGLHKILLYCELLTHSGLVQRIHRLGCMKYVCYKKINTSSLRVAMPSVKRMVPSRLLQQAVNYVKRSYGEANEGELHHLSCCI